MKIVKLTRILDYYDGIQTFAAEDPAGSQYVCVMIDTVGDFGRYAVVNASPQRMNDFMTGSVDLRTLMLETPGGKWYIATADGTIDDPLLLEPQSQPMTDANCLPEAGFFIADPVRENQ